MEDGVQHGVIKAGWSEPHHPEEGVLWIQVWVRKRATLPRLPSAMRKFQLWNEFV
jgi:hypothetical protein